MLCFEAVISRAGSRNSGRWAWRPERLGQIGRRTPGGHGQGRRCGGSSGGGPGADYWVGSFAAGTSTQLRAHGGKRQAAQRVGGQNKGSCRHYFARPRRCVCRRVLRRQQQQRWRRRGEGFSCRRGAPGVTARRESASHRLLSRRGRQRCRRSGSPPAVSPKRHHQSADMRRWRQQSLNYRQERQGRP